MFRPSHHLAGPMNLWSTSNPHRLVLWVMLLTLCHQAYASEPTPAPQEPSLPSTTSTPPPAFSTILGDLQQMEKDNSCRIAIALEDPVTSTTLYYRHNELFHAASTMKVPVMIEAFRRADAGQLALSDTLVVDPRCISAFDGSEFICDSREHLSSRLYQPETVLRLIEEMIIYSDNLATNLLIQRLSADRITETMRTLGARTGSVIRGLQDQKAYEAGMSNRITAQDLTALMRALDENRAASPAACEQMRQILLRQHYTQMIPLHLPPGVRVANKTGNITSVDHDTAIVMTARGNYYLTILTDQHPKDQSGKPLGAEISRKIYEAREHALNERPLH